MRWGTVSFPGDRVRGTGLKLHQGRFRLGIRKNFFSKWVVEHWNRLSRKVMDSPSLEELRRCLGVAFGGHSLLVDIAGLG